MGVEGLEELKGEQTGTEDQPEPEVPEPIPPLPVEGDDQKAAEGAETEVVTEDDFEDTPTEEDGA